MPALGTGPLDPCPCGRRVIGEEFSPGCSLPACCGSEVVVVDCELLLNILLNVFS